jgi:Tfp pilus assembly PilM family ATPase/Tfp pilus assembly protein PilN
MTTLKKCLGVDLGSNTVKVVEVAVDREGLKVLNAAAAETNVDPAASPEERRDAIVRALRELLKKSKFSSKDAVFGLPGQKVFIRRFRLPETTPERLERIVTYEARQQIPFPIDKTDLQFQFFPIPEEKEVEVLLVAVRHDEVRDFMTLVNKTGLKPRAVGVSSFAVFNCQAALKRTVDETQERIGALGKGAAKSSGPKGRKKAAGPLAALAGLPVIGKKFAPPPEQPEDESPQDAQAEFAFEEVHAFVNLGAAAMDLTVAQMGKVPTLKFSRSVPNAGNDISRAIMAGCDIASFLDAERIKKHQTRLMTFDFDMAVDEGSHNRDACLAASQATDRILAEIRRSLDFFISQPDGMAVDAIQLAGGQAQLPGMPEYVEEKLSIPVQVVSQVPEESGLIWRPQGEALTPYLPAVGLALQGINIADISVDFLPVERKITRDYPYRTTGLVAALLAGVIAIASMAGQGYTRQYQAETASLMARKGQDQAQVMAAREVQNKHDRAADKLVRVAKAFGERDYWLNFLAQIESVKPPDVLILRIQGNHDGTVRIEGACEQQRSAADFNESLRRILKNPTRAPELEAIDPVRGPQNPIPDIPSAFRFAIVMQTSDKYNLLRVTPTPDPRMMDPRGAVRPGQPGGRQPVAPGRGAGILF